MISQTYYAHSLQIYNSARETAELAYLRKKFHLICNPNGEIKWKGSMEPYYQAVENSARVVCSEYLDHIGRGVYEEIKTAMRHKIPVFVLRKFWRWFYLKKVTQLQIIDSTDWKIFFAKIK